MTPVIIELRGLRVRNRSNEQHASMAGRLRAARTAKNEHLIARMEVMSRGRQRWFRDPNQVPLAVTLTRFSPGRMDSDGAIASLKYIRDGVAEALHIDDGDERVMWLYEREQSKTFGVRIRIEETVK